MSTTPRRGSHILAVFPDLHVPFQDPACLSIIKKFVARYKPERIAILGDWADATTATSHQFCNLENRRDASVRDVLRDEYKPVNKILDHLQKHTKQTIYLEGNHEFRIQSIAARSQSEFIRSVYSLVSPHNNLIANRKDIIWVPYSPTVGLSKIELIPESEQCSALWAVHGWSASNRASDTHLKKVNYRVSVVHGHVHRATRTQPIVEPLGQRTIKAWSSGCLSELRPFYQHGRPNNWVHGFDVIYCKNDSSAWTVFHVEIKNGRAILPGGEEIRA